MDSVLVVRLGTAVVLVVVVLVEVEVEGDVDADVVLAKRIHENKQPKKIAYLFY